ncbi:MAG: 50S ribosomal protein L27 [Patescibacteria group bacterium]
MATSKSGGSTSLGRDSQPKYLGLKLSPGQTAKVGQILIRQRGTRFVPGKNVAMGGDNTLYALKEGVVRITKRRKTGFNRVQRTIGLIHILDENKISISSKP